MSDETKAPVEGEAPAAEQEKLPVEGEADPSADGPISFSIVRLTEDQHFSMLGYQVKGGKFTGTQVEVKTTEPHDLAVAFLTAIEGVLKIKRQMNEGASAFAKKLVDDAMEKAKEVAGAAEGIPPTPAEPEEKPPEPEAQPA